MSKNIFILKAIAFVNGKTTYILQKCFYFSVDYNWPRITSIFLSLLLKTVNKKKGTKKILCIGSRASLLDINALVKKSNKYQYLYVPRFGFGYILQKYVDTAAMNADNYYTDNEYAEGRNKAYTYISKMLPLLRKIVQFDCVMTSNFGYVEQQEFIRLVREQGIPVVILYKEGLVNPRFVDKISKRYLTRKTQCDLFICYNETIKKALLRSRVDGLREGNVCATGVPRLDFYLDRDTSKRKDQITLFSFKAEDKFSNIVDNDETMERLREYVRLFHLVAIRYACEHPERDVIIKTKPSQRNLSFVQEIVCQYLKEEDIPENLIITDTGDAFTYIRNSSCVLGCNSTVLLEALLAGKAVGSPDFSGFFSHPSWNLFEGYEQLLSYVASYDDLTCLLDSANEYTDIEKELLSQLFKKYIYSADGRSSIRVENSISELFH